MTHRSNRIPPGAYLLLGVALVLLLPTLTFPLGPDPGLFFVSGQKIVHTGAVHYADIVDVKPPPIYYLNALAVTLFGDGPIAIRLLDLIVQLMTIGLMILIGLRLTGRLAWGAAAGLIYSLQYVALNYANTAQVEGFVGLPLLGAAYLFTRRDSIQSRIWIGLLLGLIFTLKYSLGLLLPAFLLAEWLLTERSLRDVVLRAGAVVGGFLAPVLLLVALMTLGGMWDGFREMQEFLAGYTTVQYGSLSDWLTAALQDTPSYLADEYSLTALIAVIIGFAAGAGRSIRRHDSEFKGDQVSRFLLLSAISMLALLATVMIEGKFMSYHFLRMYAVGAMLAGYGILVILTWYSTRIVGFRRKILVGSILAGIAIAFSPIARYGFHSLPAIRMAAGNVEGFDAHYSHSRIGEEWTMQEVIDVGEHIRQHDGPSADVFVLSGVAGLIYLESQAIPPFRIYHSGFIMADHAPEVWRQQTIDFLLEQKPEWLVVHKSDQMPLITGNMKTSWVWFQEKKELMDLLHRSYEIDLENESFLVFRQVGESDPAQKGSG